MLHFEVEVFFSSASISVRYLVEIEFSNEVHKFSRYKNNARTIFETKKIARFHAYRKTTGYTIAFAANIYLLYPKTFSKDKQQFDFCFSKIKLVYIYVYTRKVDKQKARANSRIYFRKKNKMDTRHTSSAFSVLSGPTPCIIPIYTHMHVRTSTDGRIYIYTHIRSNHPSKCGGYIYTLGYVRDGNSYKRLQYLRIRCLACRANRRIHIYI